MDYLLIAVVAKYLRWFIPIMFRASTHHNKTFIVETKCKKQLEKFEIHIRSTASCSQCIILFIMRKMICLVSVYVLMTALLNQIYQWTKYLNTITPQRNITFWQRYFYSPSNCEKLECFNSFVLWDFNSI